MIARGVWDALSSSGAGYLNLGLNPFTIMQGSIRMKSFCVVLFQLLIVCCSMPALADLDEPTSKRAWLSYRNLSPTAYQSKLDSAKAKGYRPVDVEITSGPKPKYALIMRKNPEGVRWALHTTLTDSAFANKLETYRSQGFRLIDQETYRRGKKRYYAGLWIKNPKKLKWASYRRMTSEEYNEKYLTLKEQGLMPIDADAYSLRGKLRFSGVWVKQSEANDWAVRRNLSSDAFAKEFKSYQNKGFRLYDTESYRFKKRQYFAAIWVKEKSSPDECLSRLSHHAFHNKFLFHDRGYRLVDVEAYAVGSKTRYAGIWIQNDSLMDWRHRKVAEEIVDAYQTAHPSGIDVAVAHKGDVVFRQGWGLTRNEKTHWVRFFVGIHQ